MLSSESFTKDMLSNPALLSKAMIDIIEATDTSSELVINDPNNGFVMSMFADAAIFSKLSEKIDYVNSYFYRNRARTADQLYAHISEFDYVNLMASPATLPFYFAMSKDWIIEKAIPFDSNYNKIQIPATSFITMGGVTYSMYYPIDILVNRNTSAVTAFYNTDVKNSLYTLESNMLLDTREYTQNGIRYFQIKFNMFQFTRRVESYVVGSEQGFNVTLGYEDQFYAVKVFNRQSDGSWNELSYSLSKLYYDYKTPTALIELLTDISSVNITIPQVYFHTGQISQNVRVELYTTKGSINYSLSIADIDSLRDNFDTRSSSFAAPLEQMPTSNIIPGVVEVQGGSNSKTYDQMREAVVKNRLRSRVAITLDELVEAGLKAGFNITRYIDDITERVYYASNVLRDVNAMAIPTFVGSILLKDESLEGNPSTIINFTDGYKTLLPTTVFKVNEGSLVCTPLTNGEVDAIEQLSKTDLIAALNSGAYVRQPFHITLLTTPKSPKASIYNLLSPTVQNLSFIAENSNSAPQMSVLAANLIHQNDGTGGYHLLMSVTRSSNIQNVDSGNFNLYLTCKSKIGDDVYIPATYVSTDDNGDDIWEIFLSTNYHITIDNHISVMMYNSNDVLSFVELDLDQTFSIITSFNTVYEPNIPIEIPLNELLPINLKSSQTVMSQQTMRLEFGVNLSEQIYCGVNTSWGNDVFDVADETVYFKTDVPVYQTNEIGILETRVKDDVLECIQLHAMNSTPPSEANIQYPLAGIVPISPTNPTFTFSDTTGILEGMRVWGLNVPPGAVVVAVDSDSVIIDLPTTSAIPEGTEITFHNQSILIRTTEAQTEAGDVITVSDTSDLLVGQTVFGFGIGDNNTIVEVNDSTHFTLANETTEAVGDNVLLTIKNMTTHGVIKVAAGEILTDPSGEPIVVKAASNQYRIPTILFDGRLFASDMPDDQLIVNTIAQRLQNFANQIATIDVGLSESSELYYKPARTMGLAKFGIGNEETVQIPLTLSFDVTIYVDEAVYNTPNLRATMTETTHRIINEQIQKPTISTSEIGQVIKDTLGSSITAVEVYGINGERDLRFVALLESDAACSIEYTLVPLADGTVDRRPNINITYVSKPSTVDSIIVDTL